MRKEYATCYLRRVWSLRWCFITSALWFLSIGVRMLNTTPARLIDRINVSFRPESMFTFELIRAVCFKPMCSLLTVPVFVLGICLVSDNCGRFLFFRSLETSRPRRGWIVDGAPGAVEVFAGGANSGTFFWNGSVLNYSRGTWLVTVRTRQEGKSRGGEELPELMRFIIHDARCVHGLAG